jgi:hypothetical protein
VAPHLWVWAVDVRTDIQESGGLTAAGLAALNGHLHPLTLLARDVSGMSDRARDELMHECAQRGHADIVDELIKRGAHVDARDSDGRTALMVAAEVEHVPVARVLLSHGADPDLCDMEGLRAEDLSPEGHVKTVIQHARGVYALRKARYIQDVHANLMLASRHGDVERAGPPLVVTGPEDSAARAVVDHFVGHLDRDLVTETGDLMYLDSRVEKVAH